MGLIALLTVGPLLTFLEQSASAKAPQTVSTSLIHRTLNDNEQGNRVGWNPGPGPTPGYNTKVFTISDPEFNATTSIVIVNPISQTLWYATWTSFTGMDYLK
jgi:hypothetical protein